mgnify:FL=1
MIKESPLAPANLGEENGVRSAPLTPTMEGVAKSNQADTGNYFQAPIGTHDVLPPQSQIWARVVSVFAERANRFNYGLAITPIFEHAEVFERIGDASDVVRKEMYEFRDRGDRRLALRPEGTAPVVRAFVQHHPTPPWKVWYVAPNFRYERPQKGRYRQHWQIGAEALGVSDPDLDVEVVSLAAGFFLALGLGKTRLLINSMGEPDDRIKYTEDLRKYFLSSGANLGEEFLTRVKENPLRILDAKKSEWQTMIEGAPQLSDYLGDSAKEYFSKVQSGLKALDIAFTVDPRLVRGFDYYTATTFEFVSDDLDAAQNALGGGGRYDNLAQEMGGDPAPGIGFGIGMERVVLALEAQGLTEEIIKDSESLDVFVVDGTDDEVAALVVNDLREAGISVDRSYGGRSVKAQWKLADRSGATYGVMTGESENKNNSVAVKNLKTGEQVEVRREHLVSQIQNSKETKR